jgi:hypothetical protein
MDLTQDFIEANGLEANQVEAITKYIDSEVKPSIKKEYDGVANKNAEGILTGASKYAREAFGVEIDRDQGEKFGDYLKRISDAGLSSRLSDLKSKESELEDKLKNFKGSSELKEKYELELSKNDALLKQLAELEPLKGLDEKYKAASEQLSGLKLNVAFNSVKPNFPDTVNAYEAKAKWDEFKNDVLSNYTIELVDNEPIAIDKDNEHKRKPLKELLEANSNIGDLLKTRQQSGTGAKSADLIDVDGVPFKVPQGATSEEQSKMVREYLVEKLGSPLHKDFSKEMVDLLTKVKQSAK